MAALNGVDITKRLRAFPNLNGCPVIVLSTSGEPRDRATCYTAGASAYLIKPTLFSEWQTMLSALVDFWQWANPEINA